MDSEPADLESDPPYFAGLLDALGRIHFDISEESNDTFSVRPVLRIVPHGTKMRESMVGIFLEQQGYQYDFIDKWPRPPFFQIQQRKDLKDLEGYLRGQSAHLIRELEFVTGLFADKYDFEILSPKELHQFLLLRDRLRFGWRPRGRYHISPSAIEDRYDINSEVAVPALPDSSFRSEYTIEWIAGVFDGICRYRPLIAQSPECRTGYSMSPVARIYRSGIHASLVTFFQQFCKDHGIDPGDTSGRNDLRITFTGPANIRDVLDILLPHLYVLAEPSAMIVEEILPRFDAGEHWSKQGFYDLFCDFDRISRASGGPFRGRKYDPEYFTRIWEVELNPDWYRT